MSAALQRFSFSTATDATTDATKRAPLKLAQDAKNTVRSGERSPSRKECNLNALISLHCYTIAQQSQT